MKHEKKPGQEISRYYLDPQRDLFSCLVSFLLFFGIVTIAISIDERHLSTLLLFFMVTLGGVILVKSRSGLDARVSSQLAFFWCVKLLITFLLVVFAWSPELTQENSYGWGSDQQRFYKYSAELLAQNWDPSGIVQNYQGVIWFYAAVFAVFGRNPFSPALINSFLTLGALLFLIQHCIRVTPLSQSHHRYLPLVILVPEIIWYDVMPGREALVAAFIIISSLKMGALFSPHDRPRSRTVDALILLISVVMILAVRTVMIIPLIITGCIFLYLVSSYRSSMFLRAGVALFLASALVFGYYAQTFLGGYGTNYFEILRALQSVDENIAAEAEWSANSIGLLLAPSGLWEAVAFLPLRMIVYIIAPLPNFPIDLYRLASGSWYSWQHLLVIPTSLLMLSAVPLVFVGTMHAWRQRAVNGGLFLIPLVFWINFAAIAGGNYIIQERYRAMVTGLFFVCAWIGLAFSKKKHLVSGYLIWGAVLATGMIGYFSLKF